MTLTLTIYVGSSICMITRIPENQLRCEDIRPRDSEESFEIARNAMNDSATGQQISGYVPGIRRIPACEGSGHSRVLLVTAQVPRRGRSLI